MIKNYYQLTKPGIIRGNMITAAAGFFLASKGQVDILLLLKILVGLSLVIASGCVFNNYIDRTIDKKMERTKKRELISGVITSKNAIVFATLIGIIGIFILLLTNIITTFIAAMGFFFYVVMYSVFKRRSLYGTIVGSVSGAIPPVVGYTAVTNSFDVGAILLFLILVTWQMPHFYAIAIFRLKDYKAARIPVLPIIKGIATTKVHISIYICLFIVATSALTVVGLTGYLYLIIMVILGTAWLMIGQMGYRKIDDVKWARKMFGFSLVTLLVWSVLISIEGFIRI